MVRETLAKLKCKNCAIEIVLIFSQIYIYLSIYLSMSFNPEQAIYVFDTLYFHQSEPNFLVSISNLKRQVDG